MVSSSLDEAKDKRYGKFNVYGELSDKTVRTTPMMTKRKITNALLKIDGARYSATKSDLRLNQDNVASAEKWLLSNGFRKEGAAYAKEKIHIQNDETVYGAFVKDQRVAIKVNGTSDGGKFISEWPYPDNGNETKTLILTYETVVVIKGRNTMFDEEQVWIATIFAPEKSPEEEGKSGAYRFKFERDVINT